MKVAVAVLQYAMALAQTPTGHAAVAAAGGPVAGLLLTFGVAGLSSALSEWTAPEISEAEIETRLAAKGFKVVPFDAASLWGK